MRTRYFVSFPVLLVLGCGLDNLGTGSGSSSSPSGVSDAGAGTTLSDAGPLDSGEPVEPPLTFDAGVDLDAGDAGRQQPVAGFPAHIGAGRVPAITGGTPQFCRIDTSTRPASVYKTNCTNPTGDDLVTLGANAGITSVDEAADGFDAALVVVNAVDIASLIVVGNRALVLYAADTLTVADVDASALGTTRAGAGGDDGSAAFFSGRGFASAAVDKIVPGGSGGGFLTDGGGVVIGAGKLPGGLAHGAEGELLGGASGGFGAFASTACGRPGRGGGAVQLSSAGALTVNGKVHANGGGGQGGCSNGGGAGGGSGGTIFIESVGAMTFGVNARLLTNGGGGGSGGKGDREGLPGANGDAVRTNDPADGGAKNGKGGAGGKGGIGNASPTPGVDGDARGPATHYFGGGGGSVGKVFLRTKGTAPVLTADQASPVPVVLAPLL